VDWSSRRLKESRRNIFILSEICSLYFNILIKSTLVSDWHCLETTEIGLSHDKSCWSRLRLQLCLKYFSKSSALNKLYLEFYITLSSS
jgi:hypothetical protein